MALANKVSYLTVEEYLRYEKDSPLKHEYVDGQLYAMEGASDNHIRISGNLCNRLDAHLAEDKYESFIADMKVQVRPGLFYYPDVVVTCDAPDPYYRREPLLIVEVSSPSTERIDRHEKLAAYQQMPSLKEILLVSQERVQIELYRRQTTGEWSVEVLTSLAEDLHLQSVGVAIPVAQVYRRVNFAVSKGKE